MTDWYIRLILKLLLRELSLIISLKTANIKCWYAEENVTIASVAALNIRGCKRRKDG